MNGSKASNFMESSLVANAFHIFKCHDLLTLLLQLVYPKNIKSQFKNEQICVVLLYEFVVI